MGGSLVHSSPITENHAFAPSFNNAIFNDWFEKGIHSFLDVFIDQTFPTNTEKI